MFHQKQSKKGKGERWISSKSNQYSKTLRAAPFANKQKQRGDGKAWWFVVVARGKVRLVPIGAHWGQTGHGMAKFIEKLPRLLRNMCGANELPQFVLSDRGPGFDQSSSGAMVDAYKGALGKNELKPFAGEDASWQLSDLADLFMHDVVAAWVRKYFQCSPMCKTADLH